MRTPLVILCLLGASSIAIAQEEEAVLQTYDIRALTAPEGAEEAILRVPVELPIELPGSGFEEEEPGDGVPLRLGYSTRPLEPKILEELLHLAPLGLPSGDDQSQWIRFAEGQLIVKAPPETHDRIGKILDALEAALFRQVTVEAHRLDSAAFGKAASSAFLTPGQVEALLERHSPSSSERIQAISGLPVRHQTGELHTYVQDYDVEVTDGATSGDPQIGVFREGLDLGLSVHPTLDGGHLVRLGARETRLKSMRHVQLAEEELGALELPAIETSIALASGVVSEGGGLLIGSSSDRGAWLIRLKTVEESPAMPAELGCSLVPVAQLGLPLRIEWLESLSPERSTSAFGFGKSQRPEGPSGLLDTFRLLSNVELSRHEVATSWRLRDRLLVYGPEAARSRVAELARGLVGQRDPSWSVELRYGFVDTATAAALLSGDVPQSLPDTLEHQVMSATRLNEHFRAVSGTEHAYLEDQVPEMAKEVWIQDPVIDTFFEGLVWEGRLGRLRDGQLDLDGHLHFSKLRAPLGPLGGMVHAVDLPRVLETSARLDVVLRPDRWEILHLASLEGGDQPKGSRFVCLIRVR